MKKKRARLYGRYSSTNQKEESIEQQFDACKAYAEREGYVITGEYADMALTGKEAERRTQFMKMLRDAERGLFDVLLVWKMDRFARNRYDSAIFKKLLKESGVKVISVMEYIPEGAEGILLESMLDGYAEYFSFNLGENVRRGRNKAAKKAKFTGGRIPFGYDVDDEGRFIIDEERAAIVREAFERHSKGETRKAIYESFNARGLVTRDGKPFQRATMDSMFRNPKYIGIYRFNTFDGDEIILEGGCPAIVPREQWDIINRKRENGSPSRKARRGVYPLSGITRCGVCGCAYYGGEVTPRGKKTYTYYSHNRETQAQIDCKGRRYVNQDVLDSAVLNLILSTVLNEELVDEIVKKAMEIQEEEKGDDTALLTSELEQVKTALTNIYSAIEAGLFSAGLQERFENLEDRRKALEDELAKKGVELDKLTPEQIKSFLTSFRDGDLEDVDFQRVLMRQFVRQVILTPDAALVLLNYAPSDDGQLLLAIYDDAKAMSHFANNEKGLAFKITLPPRLNAQ